MKQYVDSPKENYMLDLIDLIKAKDDCVIGNQKDTTAIVFKDASVCDKSLTLNSSQPSLLIESAKVVGSWMMFGRQDMQMQFLSSSSESFKKPSLLRRLIVRLILGWKWIDYA